MTQNILETGPMLTGWSLAYCDTQKPGGQASKGRFSASNVLFTIRRWARYLRMVIVKRPDLVHLPLSQNETGFMRDSLFIWTAKLLRRPILLHFHGGAFDQFYVRQPYIAKKFIRLTLANAELLVVLGNKIAKQFDHLIDPSRVTSIPNCVAFDGEELSRPSRTTEVQILFLGKISVAKGAIDLVNAADVVNQGSLEGRLKFRLVGDYIDVERNITFIKDANGVRQRLAELLGRSRCKDIVSILPATNGRRKWAEYKNADIFVAPSYSEGCPLTVLEAMAMELPVIATDVGALPEILVGDQSSFLVPVGSPALLAERISKLAQDPDLRRRLGRQNRLEVEKTYSLPAFAERLQRAYDLTTRSPK